MVKHWLTAVGVIGLSFSLKHSLYYYHIDKIQTAVECFDISRIEKNYFLSLFVIMLYYMCYYYKSLNKSSFARSTWVLYIVASVWHPFLNEYLGYDDSFTSRNLITFYQIKNIENERLKSNKQSINGQSLQLR